MAGEIDNGEDLQIVDSFYRNDYQRLFETRGLSGWGYRLSHRMLEHGSPKSFGRVLEIGAGEGQHLNWVNHSFDEYVMLDPSVPKVTISDSRIRFVQRDAENPSLDLGEFDRVIATCVLHHVQDVAAVLRNVKRWVAPGGEFRVFLPCDPGLLNRVFRSVVVSTRARRIGIQHYPVVNAREHRNHFWGIRTELLHQFADWSCRRRYYPFLLPIPGANLFSVWIFRRRA